MSTPDSRPETIELLNRMAGSAPNHPRVFGEPIEENDSAWQGI